MGPLQRMNTRQPVASRWWWRLMGGLLVSLALLAGAACSRTPAEDPPQLLYYMSFQCPGCRQVNPLLESMHQAAAGRYTVRALAFGTALGDIPAQQRKAGLSFPVVVGSKSQAMEHGVRATPTVILLQAGAARERYQGVSGVRRLQRMVESGALGHEVGILELARQPGAMAARQVTLRGQLMFVGENAMAVLGNGVETVRLTLAPQQAGVAPAPIGAELVGKDLRVQGQVQLENGAVLVRVQQWEVVS